MNDLGAQHPGTAALRSFNWAKYEIHNLVFERPELSPPSNRNSNSKSVEERLSSLLRGLVLTRSCGCWRTGVRKAKDVV